MGAMVLVVVEADAEGAYLADRFVEVGLNIGR